MLNEIETYLTQIIDSKKYFTIGKLLYSDDKCVGTAFHPVRAITKSDLIASAKDTLPFNTITGFDLKDLKQFLNTHYPI